jgi:hypothetical protein
MGFGSPKRDITVKTVEEKIRKLYTNPFIIVFLKK